MCKLNYRQFRKIDKHLFRANLLLIILKSFCFKLNERLNSHQNENRSISKLNPQFKVCCGIEPFGDPGRRRIVDPNSGISPDGPNIEQWPQRCT